MFYVGVSIPTPGKVSRTRTLSTRFWECKPSLGLLAMVLVEVAEEPDVLRYLFTQKHEFLCAVHKE